MKYVLNWTVVVQLVLVLASLPARGQAGAEPAPFTPTTLEPRRLLVGKDTVFYYTREQNRYLLILITEGKYDRAELRVREKQVDTLVKQVKGRGIIINALQDEVKNRDLRIAARDSLLGRMDGQLAISAQVNRAAERKLRRDWWLKRLLVVGVVVAFVGGMYLGARQSRN